MSTAIEELTLPKFRNRIPNRIHTVKQTMGNIFLQTSLFNLFSLVLKEKFSIDLIHT